jgi:transposase
MQPYPIELRQRAVAAYEAGEGTREEIAVRFHVSERALAQWIARFRAEGTVEPRAPGGGWTSPVDRELIEKILAELVDATTHEITAQYNKRVPKNARVHRSSVQRALHRFGYVNKKNGFGRRNSSVRTSSRSAGSS